MNITIDIFMIMIINWELPSRWILQLYLEMHFQFKESSVIFAMDSNSSILNDAYVDSVCDDDGGGGGVCLVGGAESSLPWNKGVSTRTTLGQAVASKKFVERQKA